MGFFNKPVAFAFWESERGGVAGRQHAKCSHMMRHSKVKQRGERHSRCAEYVGIDQKFSLTPLGSVFFSEKEAWLSVQQRTRRSWDNWQLLKVHTRDRQSRVFNPVTRRRVNRTASSWFTAPSSPPGFSKPGATWRRSAGSINDPICRLIYFL